jgi:hypothetical protein
MSIRNFRRPTGLAFPPLPCNGGDANDHSSLAGRQAGSLAGCLDGGGVGHQNPRPPRTTIPASRQVFPAASIRQTPLSPLVLTGPSARAVQLSRYSGATALRSKAARADERKRKVLVMAATPFDGLRNAALCESLYPLDIDCQGVRQRNVVAPN